jgi:fumarylacetoacetase
MIKANNPQIKSWITVHPNSDFPIQNLPLGIFKTKDLSARVCSIIGDTVIDIAALNHNGLLKNLGLEQDVLEQEHLNSLIELGKEKTGALRQSLSELFESGNSTLRDNETLKSKILHDVKSVELLMPIKVGDYTDFYSSIEHATNVGTMFRDPNNALLPNWKHIPIGYHGRASSIAVSGTNFLRPQGQTKAPDATLPSFGPSKQLDFELEMAFVIGKKTQAGDQVSTKDAEAYIFGLMLFNDWSARDIQAWEYVPLGPFLAKNFASTVSPWVISLEALEPFKVAGPVQEPKVLPYLEFEGEKNYDVNLEVYIAPENQNPHRICQSNFKYMYWNMNQQLAHHTVNGCNINVGDLMASGTISGKDPHSYGSMLELTWRGTKPIQMPDGSERKFINDNDTVIMKGFCEKDGIRIGFGDVVSKALPARQK